MAISLHFGCLPTTLTSEQVQDYLYLLQKRSKTPSQSFFKLTVYGLRFMLRTEGLSYEFLHLPAIKKDKKLPVILSREEIWLLLKSALLLKHGLLIGLLYGCGLRCNEVRNIELKNLDFDRKMLHIVRSKGNKDRYVPLSEHLIRGIKKYLVEAQPQQYLFERSCKQPKGSYDIRYSSRGIQHAVKDVSRRSGILKSVHPHMLRHTYATHLLEDGVNIVTVQKLLGHADIKTTMIYLHVCQVPDQFPNSPLDKVFERCSRSGK